MRTVLFLTSHLSIGGAEKVLVKQVEILRKNGYEPHIVCTDVYGKFGDYLRQMDFPILDISRHSKRRKKIELITQKILEIEPSIVFVSNSEFSEAIEKTKATLRYSVVLQAHGCLKTEGSFTHKLFKHYEGLLDLVIVTHPLALTEASKHYDFHKLVVPNPVDDYFFEYPFVEKKKNIIGFCGRISPEKSLLSMGRICGILAKTIPDLGVIIIGDADDHYSRCLLYKEKVIEVFKEEKVPLKISGYKIFCPSIMSEVRVMAHLSVTEGYGNAVWEALALGIPVVSLDVGASYMALNDKKAGFLIPWTWDGTEFEIPERLYHEIAARLYWAMTETYDPEYIRSLALGTHEERYEETFLDIVESFAGS